MFNKNSIWFLTPLILLLIIPLMVSGCQSKTPPEVQQPKDPAKPAGDIVLNIANEADYSNLNEYTEPGAYSIKYPAGWDLQGGGQKTGFEIFALYKADLEAINKGAHGGQDPNSAKIAVSIDIKGGRSFDQAVQDYYNNNELDNRDDRSKEELSINENKAVRFYYTHDNPIISLLIDIDQERYAIITGYHGNGSEKDALVREIKLIQETFRAEDN